MAIELNLQESADAIHSLRRYFTAELEMELSELQARLLLDFLLKEIGPFAYNRGVRDAEEFLRGRLEDLSATCYEPPLAFWQSRKRP